jgi:hypothetical protein
MERGKKEYLAPKAAWSETRSCLSAKGVSCPNLFADVQLLSGGFSKTLDEEQ